MPNQFAILKSRIGRVIYRARAWQRLMTDGETLKPDARIAMAHIKRFARYGRPPAAQDRTGRTDLFETGRMVGRQEVVQLIVEALNLDETVLVNLQEDISNE